MDDRQRERIRQHKLRIRRVKRIKKMLLRTAIIVVLLMIILLVAFSCSDKKEQNTNPDTEKDNVEQQVENDMDLEVEEENESDIDIVMIGDMLLHDNVQQSGVLEDGRLNYDHLFRNIRQDVKSADLAIVNQEVILGGAEEIGLRGYPSFNGAYEVGDALVRAGFNVVLHATNHALDHGSKALLNCINYWETRHPEVAYLGIHDSQEEYDNDIYVYEQNGVKIAILNYTYGTNDIPMPEGMPYAVNLLEEQKVIYDIQRAEEIADFTIVCPHWGLEYLYEPDPSETYWADIFLEYGVDLVIGAHPHFIQPVEVLKDDKGNEMLVYWSLGNFVNSTSIEDDRAPAQMVGAMAEITLSVDEEGSVYIKEYGVEPLVTQLMFGKQEITTYKLVDYTEELALKNKVREVYPDFNLEYCQNLCEKVFGDLY